MLGRGRRLLRPGECKGLTVGFVRHQHPLGFAFTAPFPGKQKPQFSSKSTKLGFPFPPPPPVLGPTVGEQLGKKGVSSWHRDGSGGAELRLPAMTSAPCIPTGRARSLWGYGGSGRKGARDSSHALGPCCSVLSPSQGRTKPGLLLWPRGAGCVGRRRARWGAGRAQAAPLQAAPSACAVGNTWPHSSQSTLCQPKPQPWCQPLCPGTQAGCHKAQSTALGRVSAGGQPPEDTGQGCPCQQWPQAPGGGWCGQGGQERSRSPAATPLQTQYRQNPVAVVGLDVGAEEGPAAVMATARGL